jgi:hypothetical protein
MRKIIYTDPSEISDDILKIKYADYYLADIEGLEMNTELKRHGYILEDVNELLPQAVVRPKFAEDI